MKNTIEAKICFDFRGESYTISSIIDINSIENFDNFYQKVYQCIINENNIGQYSYEYEIILSSNILFYNPIGIIETCLDDTDIDIEKLKTCMQDYKYNEFIKTIMKKYNLNEDNSIKHALYEAILYKG
jgi:hypothetical protein